MHNKHFNQIDLYKGQQEECSWTVKPCSKKILYILFTVILVEEVVIIKYSNSI